MINQVREQELKQEDAQNVIPYPPRVWEEEEEIISCLQITLKKTAPATTKVRVGILFLKFVICI